MRSDNKEENKTAGSRHGHPKKHREDCKCKGNCPCCGKKDDKRKQDEKGKVIVVSGFALLMAIPAFAQDASARQSFWTDPFHHPMLPVYTMMAFLGVTIALMLVTMIHLVRVIKFLVRQNDIKQGEKDGVRYVPQLSMLERLWQDLNASVPVAKEQDIDMGHSYDGIRELDNHLPPWWKGLFYACIIWGIAYMIVYHVTDSLPLSIGEYESELATADEKARILRASKPAELIDENSLVYTADVDLIGKGKIVFTSNNCGSCHRADGGGNTIGPNLTDDYWLHGGSIRNIYTTINTGVLEKGMPAWGKVMGATDVRNVAFYIMSLRGSNPADAKAPQGKLDQPEQTPIKADSTTSIAN